MKKILALGLVVTMMSALLAGCGNNTTSTTPASSSDSSTSTESVKTTTLKVGHVYGDSYAMHVALQHMSDTVYEKTNGRYQLEIHPNSELGGESDLIEGVQLGSVDMCFTATTPLANTVPAVAKLDLPFLVDDYNHADACFYNTDSEIRQSIIDDIDNGGFKCLTLCENGFRKLVTNKPINSIEDLKNLKIRVMENQLHLELWNALGASPTTMSASEALTGIQQGTVDAVEMFNSAIISVGFAELVDYYVATNHIYTVGTLLMNQKVFNNMSAEDQQVFMDAAAEMARETNESLRSTDEEFYNQLVGDTYGLTECFIDNDQLREMTQAVFDNHPEYADFVAAVQAKSTK